jgi:glycosyltransferase involved in cell wall biosynthesis
VIVVDDGSVARDAVAAVVARHAFARVVRVPQGGPAAARNAGARRARGGVVCFTDDDCEPRRTWAQALARAIENGAHAAAGRTLSARPGSALAAAAEVVAEAPALADIVSDGLSFAPSNNLACRADVVTAIPFDERYPAAAGEDRDWCARLAAAGHVLRSEPAAELVHRPSETLGAFLQQQVRYGRGAYRFRVVHARSRLEPPGYYGRLARRGFTRGLRAGLLVCVAQVATAVGFALEWRGSRRPAEVPSDALRDGCCARQVVEDVKGQRGNYERGPATAQEHPIERVVEHED